MEINIKINGILMNDGVAVTPTSWSAKPPIKDEGALPAHLGSEDPHCRSAELTAGRTQPVRRGQSPASGRRTIHASVGGRIRPNLQSSTANRRTGEAILKGQ